MCNLRNFIVRKSDRVEMAIAIRLLEALVTTHASRGIAEGISVNAMLSLKHYFKTLLYWHKLCTNYF